MHRRHSFGGFANPPKGESAVSSGRLIENTNGHAYLGNRMIQKKVFRIITRITVLILLLETHRAIAQEFLVGVRGGTSFERDAGNFQEIDIFASKYLPWLWGSNNGWNLKPRWEASVGCLHNEGWEGFVGSTGPVFELRARKFPMTLEGGVSLTALSQYEFPDRDLGGWFQFTDHVGLNWHITKQFTLGWRFQHTSNAGIYRRNPGLNLQMLSASYAF